MSWLESGPGVAPTLTSQPQRHRRPTHAKPVGNPLMTPTIRTKLPDLDHVFGRQLSAASDLDTLSP